MNNLINVTRQDGILVVSSREVARNFEKNHQHILRDIDGLKEGVQNWTDLFLETNYVHEQNKQEYREILMNRDGFTLLAMGFTGKKALEWKLKYIEAFNKMENAIKNQLTGLSPELQVLINLELQQKQLQQDIAENKQEIQDMRDVIALDVAAWRKGTADLINKMALKVGGFEHIRTLREESYELLNKRMGVDLKIRLTNKRRRMAEEGVCKSRRDKLTYVDIIAEDKKLIEGYTAIVKEMAIKCGVA